MAYTAWPMRNLLRRNTQQMIANTRTSDGIADLSSCGPPQTAFTCGAQDRDSVVPRRNRANCSSALLRASRRTRVTIPLAEQDTRAPLTIAA